MLKSGMVTLVGRPNVGKSSLLNAFLKDQISIVTPKAQTTRDQVRGVLTEDRGQVVFVDTPGIHQAKEGGINEYMIHEIHRSLEDPDLILYLIDPASRRKAEAILLEPLKRAKGKLVILVNKVDLKKKYPAYFGWIDEWVAELKAELADTRCELIDVVEISATKKLNLDALLEKVFELLPEGPFLYQDADILTDRPVRFVVSELIRKQLFLSLGDELPYSCAVEIERYQENKKPVLIQALIHVERDSQKGMVIGAGGKKIKEIGSNARAEIEDLIGEKVFLELRVKVMEGWTSEANKMKFLGYDLFPGRKAVKKRKGRAQ